MSIHFQVRTFYILFSNLNIVAFVSRKIELFEVNEGVDGSVDVEGLAGASLDGHDVVHHL